MSNTLAVKMESLISTSSQKSQSATVIPYKLFVNTDLVTHVTMNMTAAIT